LLPIALKSPRDIDWAIALNMPKGRVVLPRKGTDEQDEDEGHEEAHRFVPDVVAEEEEDEREKCQHGI
jgi:hypothetical protein